MESTAQLSVFFMRLIAELNVAIKYCKHGFAYMEAEYRNAFPPAGNVGHDLALDIAMQNFKHEHQHLFESLCNNRLLILETETAMDELIAKLKRCKDNFAAMEDVYFDVNQYGVVDHYWAMAIAMINLRHAHWYMEWACDNARYYLMTQGQQVAPNANAVQFTAAEPVVANVSEEHNTSTIPEGTAENNTAAREEMVEGNSNTSSSEETVENNLHQLALDPNKERLNS